jgi:iron complex transport system permease protein
MNRKLSGRFVGTDSGKALALAALLCLLAAASLLAVALGTVRIPLSTILDAIFRFDGSRNHLLVVAVRLPRVIAALLAGSALAVSGAIMQAITNNPLASPGLLGINAGAAFAVVSIMTFFGAGVGDIYIWFAFLGAGIAAFAVTLLSSSAPSVIRRSGSFLPVRSSRPSSRRSPAPCSSSIKARSMPCACGRQAR